MDKVAQTDLIHTSEMFGSVQSQAGEAGFQARKSSVLTKRDKSSAGRIDPKAVEICALINTREEFYTTSSCAGRCFIYRGDGIKSFHHFSEFSESTEEQAESSEPSEHSIDHEDTKPMVQGFGFFERYRVNHDIIRDSNRYWDLNTLHQDPSGGGDPVRDSEERVIASHRGGENYWLRFEPFILHVMCRSLSAASALMASARPAFKNVGLTSYKHRLGKYVVAIWGDEGLDMPLNIPQQNKSQDANFLYVGQEEWLSELVNNRHIRNWKKIQRFVQAVRVMPKVIDDIASDWIDLSLKNDEHHFDHVEDNLVNSMPKRFDVVGDVALIHGIPHSQDREAIGKIIMERNKAIKIVAARETSLSGSERSIGKDGLVIIAGAERSPLITTHMEYGVKCVVNLNKTFFTCRMGPERIRICQQVARKENVLVLFSGVCMDAFQIVARTEANVLAIELNPEAIRCARLGHRMLERNKSIKCAGASKRLTILEGDALKIMNDLERQSYDRIVAPRPKEGNLDNDLGAGDGGLCFLEALLPLLKDQGECHWYDFVADHEISECKRIKKSIQDACDKLNLTMEILHIAQVGSIAKRQLRVCLDFRVIYSPKNG